MCICIFDPANGEGFLYTSHASVFGRYVNIDEFVKQPLGMLMNRDFETREYNSTGLLVYSYFVN
jgi:hypothetical protein